MLFLGDMNNWDRRELMVDLSFLGTGSYEAEIYADGQNADTNPSEVVISRKKVSQGENLNLILAKGGGCGIIFRKVN